MAEILNGQIAIAESAIRAGARLFAGYPITPSTDIMEYMSYRMEEVGGTFVQAESEIAGVYMVMGGLAAGVRSFTASSGPGLSLKQEAISVLADEQLPAVVVNMVRYGSGIGTLVSSQSDYLRETRGGGNGDYRTIVLAPESVQEAADLTMLAFELAEKYRMVALLMAEGALGQMKEPCELPEYKEPTRFPWGFDGKYTNKKIGIFDRDSVKEAEEMREKYATIKAKEQRWESGYLEDAEYIFVGFGLAGRSMKGAVKELREEGHKVGFIRIITAWPFPEKAFKELNANVKGIISMEVNATVQLADDIALTMKRLGKDIPIYGNPRVWGVPAVKAIKDDYDKVVKGEMEAVY